MEAAIILMAGSPPAAAPAATATAPPMFPPGFDPAVMGEQLRSIAAQMSGVGGSVETLSDRLNVVESVANSHDAAIKELQQAACSAFVQGSGGSGDPWQAKAQDPWSHPTTAPSAPQMSSGPERFDIGTDGVVRPSGPWKLDD